MNKDDAITNAINNISGNDKAIVDFLNDSKAKIDNYFKTNCNDVMKQGERALAINDYSQAIALFFSVPSSAPCYENALKRSEAVYTKFVEDECNKKLIKLKAFVALAPSSDVYYDSVVNVMEDINPVSPTCYAEAEQIFSKVEARLSDEKKQQWELRKQALTQEGDIQKEMYKAMAEINRNYEPASTIIITH